MSSRLPLVLLAGGGASWLLGQAVLPDMGTRTAQRYDAVAAAQTAEAWSAALLVVAGCLLVLGALATARATAGLDGRGARLVSLGAGLLALGGIWLVGGRAVFNMLFLRVVDPGVPREVAVGVLDDGGGVEFVPLVLTLPCLLLGPLLLAIGLRRAGLVGWGPLVAWVLGIGVFLGTEFVLKAGEVAGIALAAVALAWIGRTASRLEDTRARTGPTGPTAGSVAPQSEELLR